MRKIIYSIGLLIMLATVVTSCKKSSTTEISANVLTQEEKTLIASAGFNSSWAERTAEGSYLVEGDILLTRAQLQEMSGATPTNNIIVADEEHYRTYNLVSTPSTGYRTITVRLSGTFPSHYSTGLNNAIARYNGYNLKIRFSRV